MEENLSVVYLLVLIGLLGSLGLFVVRQVLKTRRVERTLNELQNTVKQGKGTAKEYYALASIYLDKKLYSQAITLLQKALKNSEDVEDENKALMYNALGFAYAAQDQVDLAIRNYKDAIKCAPDYVTAFNNLGNAYEKKQLLTPALEAYQQALAIDGTNTVAKRRVESLQKRLPVKAA